MKMDQGIFFIAANSTATRVNKIITMSNSEVVFVVPSELVPGEYTVELRMLPKGNKTMKKGLLKDRLTV